MEEALKQLKTELQKKAIKLTRQREQILKLFLKPGVHLLTAAQIQDRLEASDQRMDTSTIYRNLETLTTAGILRHIALNDHIARYELVTDHHHHHLICLECSRTEIVELCPFQEINDYVTSHTDFLPTEHRFEIYGYCQHCRPREDEKNRTRTVRRDPHDHSGH